MPPRVFPTAEADASLPRCGVADDDDLGSTAALEFAKLLRSEYATRSRRCPARIPGVTARGSSKGSCITFSTSTAWRDRPRLTRRLLAGSARRRPTSCARRRCTTRTGAESRDECPPAVLERAMAFWAARWSGRRRRRYRSRNFGAFGSWLGPRACRQVARGAGALRSSGSRGRLDHRGGRRTSRSVPDCPIEVLDSLRALSRDEGSWDLADGKSMASPSCGKHWRTRRDVRVAPSPRSTLSRDGATEACDRSWRAGEPEAEAK